MDDLTQTARTAIAAALDALGGSEAILTAGIVNAQLDPAERQFLMGVKCTEFNRARQIWMRERDAELVTRYPRLFKAKKEEAGLFR